MVEKARCWASGQGLLPAHEELRVGALRASGRASGRGSGCHGRRLRMDQRASAVRQTGSKIPGWFRSTSSRCRSSEPTPASTRPVVAPAGTLTTASPSTTTPPCSKALRCSCDDRLLLARSAADGRPGLHRRDPRVPFDSCSTAAVSRSAAASPSRSWSVHISGRGILGRRVSTRRPWRIRGSPVHDLSPTYRRIVFSGTFPKAMRKPLVHGLGLLASQVVQGRSGSIANAPMGGATSLGPTALHAQGFAAYKAFVVAIDEE